MINIHHGDCAEVLRTLDTESISAIVTDPLRGRSRPIKERKIEIICQYCSKVFSVAPSRLRHGRGKHCSPTCQYKTKKEAPKLPQLSLICLGCGIMFSRLPCILLNREGGGKYCSRKCRNIYRVGSLVPNWFNAPRKYRGPNWQRQKRAAMKRDGGICQNCESPAIDIHHIVPYRRFNGDWQRANDLKNLVSLCKPCHRKTEADIHKNEKLSECL